MLYSTVAVANRVAGVMLRSLKKRKENHGRRPTKSNGMHPRHQDDGLKQSVVNLASVYVSYSPWTIHCTVNCVT